MRRALGRLPPNMVRIDPSAFRDLGIALSLANICQLRMWATILSAPGRVRSPHAAAIANTLLLTLALWILARLLRRYGSPRVFAAARGLLVVTLLACIPSIVRAIWPALEEASWFVPARASLFGLFAVAVAVASARGKGPLLSAAACRVLLALLPAVAVTVGQSAWQLAGVLRVATTPVNAQADAGATAEPARPRVVVLLLDEMDYDLAFGSRPYAVEMPALERFRKEALWGTQAYPPHMHTLQSIPASLTGRLVEESRLTAQGHVDVKFRGSQEWVSLDEQPTLFSELQKQGLRSSVVGYWFPYEQVFSRYATCLDSRRRSMRDRMARQMVTQSLAVAADLPIMLPGLWAHARRDIETRTGAGDYHAFVDTAEQEVVNASNNFTFLHALVPHRPYIFNRETGEMTIHPGRTYIDNLVLADRTFARLRAAMEAHGEWDEVTMIVMSDHWLRTRVVSDGSLGHRVFFALKLPGRQAGVDYTAPFNTVLLHDLVLALMRRELHQHADVARWLDRHRTFGESPLTIGIKPDPANEPDLPGQDTP